MIVFTSGRSDLKKLKFRLKKELKLKIKNIRL